MTQNSKMKNLRTACQNGQNSLVGLVLLFSSCSMQQQSNRRQYDNFINDNKENVYTKNSTETFTSVFDFPIFSLPESCKPYNISKNGESLKYLYSGCSNNKNLAVLYYVTKEGVIENVTFSLLGLSHKDQYDVYKSIVYSTSKKLNNPHPQIFFNPNVQIRAYSWNCEHSTGLYKGGPKGPICLNDNISRVEVYFGPNKAKEYYSIFITIETADSVREKNKNLKILEKSF